MPTDLALIHRRYQQRVARLLTTWSQAATVTRVEVFKIISCVKAMAAGRKILFVSSNFPPVVGGSSVVYDQVCRCLGGQVVGAGASHDYSTGRQWPRLADEDKARPYVIYRIPFLRPPIIGRRTSYFGRLIDLLMKDSPTMARTLLFVVALVIKYRVEVVCLGELVSNGWLVFPLRYVLGRRVLIYTHGEEITQDTGGTLGRMRRGCLRHAHAIISVSLFCKGQIVSKFGVNPNRVSVVTNGVDLTAFCRNEERDRSFLPESIRNSRVILAVGRLVERKGQQQLIAALPAILARIPDAHCIIVGDGPIAANLRREATAKRLNYACTFLGNVSQERLIQLYQASDVFCLPCRTLPDGDTEGFGLVFLEANACGLAVVAGAAGGTVEAVIDNETGLLVNGNDVSAIANAVTRILTDHALRERLVEAGWTHAQQYSWQEATKNFLDVCSNAQPRSRSASYRSFEPAFTAPSAVNGSTPHIVPRLLLTIDVEEQFAWDEFCRDRHVVRGADSLARFHDDLQAICIKPVYLVTYPILQNMDFCRVFSRILADDSGEVGTHLHSWTTPPHWEQPNAFTSYQCNLPEHIERRKLELLSLKFEERFGRSATIHRAGRWGGSEQTATLLEQMGMTIDLSPSIGISDPQHVGPEFTALDGNPFWAGPHNSVLAIPASAINNLRGPQWVSRAFFAARKASATIRSLDNSLRIGKPVRFSPEGNSSAMILGMANEFVRRAAPVCVFTLHSTSLYGGGNPYSASETAAAKLHKRTIAALRQCVESKLLSPSSCAEIYLEASSQRALARCIEETDAHG